VPDWFSIDVEQADSVQVVRLRGEFDISCAEQVRAELLEIAVSSVVIDLSDLEFMDAAALSVLVAARREMRATGHRVRIRGAQGLPRRVFEITELDDLLDD
jgi:anti-sigma B factor antagonist